MVLPAVPKQPRLQMPDLQGRLDIEPPLQINF
jgi:hypothetical protein